MDRHKGIIDFQISAYKCKLTCMRTVNNIYQKIIFPHQRNQTKDMHTCRQTEMQTAWRQCAKDTQLSIIILEKTACRGLSANDNLQRTAWEEIKTCLFSRQSAEDRLQTTTCGGQPSRTVCKGQPDASCTIQRTD